MSVARPLPGVWFPDTDRHPECEPVDWGQDAHDICRSCGHFITWRAPGWVHDRTDARICSTVEVRG